MSKSRGNVINPDDVVWQYGADSLRLYEMFMGPLRDTKVGVGGRGLGAAQWSELPRNAHARRHSFRPASAAAAANPRAPPAPMARQVWSTKGVEGVHRFLARVYRLCTEQPLSDAAPDADQLRSLHATIKKARRGGGAGGRWGAGAGTTAAPP